MCVKKPTSTAASPASSARSPTAISSAGATSPTRWARIAAKNHKNGVGNPDAQLRKDLGYAFCREESEKNPRVAGPLKRTDCSPVSDGAAALVLSDVDTALKARQGDRVPRRRARAGFPADVAARRAQVRGLRAGVEAGAGASRRCALRPFFRRAHDCFTIAELIEYEAMGLVPEGQGARAIADGTVRRTAYFRSIRPAASRPKVIRSARPASPCMRSPRCSSPAAPATCR